MSRVEDVDWATVRGCNFGEKPPGTVHFQTSNMKFREIIRIDRMPSAEIPGFREGGGWYNVHT